MLRDSKLFQKFILSTIYLVSSSLLQAGHGGCAPQHSAGLHLRSAAGQPGSSAFIGRMAGAGASMATGSLVFHSPVAWSELGYMRVIGPKRVMHLRPRKAFNAHILLSTAVFWKASQCWPRFKGWEELEVEWIPLGVNR